MTTLPPIHIWPVIHLADENRRALLQQNVSIVQGTGSGGCAGVFLIHMNGDDKATMEEAIWMRQTYPGLKVGVNLLGVRADLALQDSLLAGLDATWSDSPGVSSKGVDERALKVQALLHANPSHQFFGSVAFKYQPHEPDAPAAAAAAADLGMLATTSGPATGKAPEIEKLRAMRQSLGTRPLAVASGITPDNIRELGGPLTHVLVSTGVSRSFHELDQKRLDWLSKAASKAPRGLASAAHD